MELTKRKPNLQIPYFVTTDDLSSEKGILWKDVENAYTIQNQDLPLLLMLVSVQYAKVESYVPKQSLRINRHE